MIGVAAGLDLRKLGRDGRSPGRSVSAALMRGLHVARGGVDVAGEIELDGDARRAQRAARRQLGHAGDLAEPALERGRDRRRHGLGIGARPAGGDVDGRKIHRRHAGDRQEAVGHHARQQQSDGEQRGADRPADEGFGEAAKLMPSLRRVLRWFRRLPGRSSSVCSGCGGLTRALRRSIARYIDRRRVEREQLAEQQPADDGDAERIAQLRAGAAARKRAE